jgi:Na+/melibiose symporter-like transporter
VNRVPAGAQLTVLVVLTVLLATLELMFQFAYIGPVPLPIGTLVIVLTMPWLVRTTVEAWPTTPGAALVPVVWFVVTVVFGLFGPGGDTLLVPAWQTLVLLVAGVLTGLFCFRRAVDRMAAAAAAAREDRSTRPSDPRIGNAGKVT